MSLNEKDNECERFIERIYIEYHSIMKKKSYNILKDMDLAEDIIQDAMIALIKKVDVIKNLNERQLISYVVNTVINMCYNYIRRNEEKIVYNYNIDGEYEEDLYSIKIYDVSYNPEKILLEKEKIQMIYNILNSLTKRDRDLLYFKFILELSNMEIANILKIKVECVRVYINRAKKNFLAILLEQDRDILWEKT